MKPVNEMVIMNTVIFFKLSFGSILVILILNWKIDISIIAIIIIKINNINALFVGVDIHAQYSGIFC